MTSAYLGKNVLTGKRIFLPIERLAATHTHVLGRSGAGKSKLLERIARDIIKTGYGLIVLDGKGDLYDSLLNFCAYMSVPARKMKLIDPRDPFAPGLNVLERFGATNHATQAGIVIDALKKMHGDEETKHWFEEWGKASLSPLCLAGFSLTELFEFIRTDDPAFRRAVLAKISDRYLTAKWAVFESYKPQQQAEMARVVNTRADPFVSSPYLCGMFGQLKTTINWKDVMDKGEIALAKLDVGALDQKSLSFIGTAVVHQVVRTAHAREKNRRRPCFLVMDEFQNFLTPDIATALDKLNGLGVHCILAHQNLEQLRQEDPKIYHSVMGNTRIKATFTVSREDSAIMYGEIFPDKIFEGMQKVKDEIRQTKFRPVETWRDLYTESDTDSKSVLSASEDPRVTETTTRTTARTQSPGVDHEEFEELTGRTYYSEAEVRERLISWIHTQQDRHYQLKIKDLPAIPMVSPTVEDVAISPALLERYKEKIYGLTSRPIEEVRQEVEQRVIQYVREAGAQPARPNAPNDDDLPYGQPKRSRKNNRKPEE